MTSILQMALSNVVLAGALALVVLVVTRVWRNQHVAHLLWVIVLAKLVTPPLWNVPIPVASFVDSIPPNAVQPGDRLPGEPLAGLAATNVPASAQATETVHDLTDNLPIEGDGSILNSAPAEHATLALMSSVFEESTSAASMTLEDWVSILARLWLISSVVCAIVATARVVRFHRMARRGLPADEPLVRRVKKLAKRLSLSGIPDVRLLDASISPMVWSLAWRRMLILPKGLAGELTPPQLDTVIAHELAHLLRRDDLVRFLEVVVTCLYWWNPVVWLARRELHSAEEDCCDALVVCSLPESRQQYGEALLRAAEMITFGRSLPALASTLGQQRFLKRRVEMILHHNFRRAASWQAKLFLLVVSLAVLPFAATAMPQDGTTSAVSPSAEDGVDPQASPATAVLRDAIQTEEEVTIDEHSLPDNSIDLRSAVHTGEKMIRPLYSLVGADTRITAHEQLRIIDEDTWVRFWLRHTGQLGTPADFSDTRPSGAPRIDFEQCMVLAITESPGQLNAGIRVVAITEADQQLTVNYENMPYQAREGTPAPGNAFGFFVVPRSSKAIVLRNNVRGGRSRRLGEPPIWKEVRRIAAIDNKPAIELQQSLDGPRRSNLSQSLRSDVYPEFGNGSQSAAEAVIAASRDHQVARNALNIGFAHDPGAGRYNGVTGRPGDVWNFVDIGTTAVDYLRSPEGLGTPMTLEVSQHDGEWGIKGLSGIYAGYIYHNCQCVDLNATISGLPPGRYMAYVFAHGDAPNQNADVELAVGPESYGHKATLNDGSWKFRSEKFEEGLQYVSFEFTATADQPVTITSHRAGSGYSMLNAIQIEPVDVGK